MLGGSDDSPIQRSDQKTAPFCSCLPFFCRGSKKKRANFSVRSNPLTPPSDLPPALYLLHPKHPPPSTTSHQQRSPLPLPLNPPPPCVCHCKSHSPGCYSNQFTSLPRCPCLSPFHNSPKQENLSQSVKGTAKGNLCVGGLLLHNCLLSILIYASHCRADKERGRGGGVTNH